MIHVLAPALGANSIDDQNQLRKQTPVRWASTAAIGLILIASTSGTAAGQQDPIIAAAEALNTVAPQAVASQTVRLGTYSAKTGLFRWSVPHACAPGGFTPAGNLPVTPNSQGNPVDPNPECSPYGGSSRGLELNSYNVTYEIGTDLAPATAGRRSAPKASRPANPRSPAPSGLAVARGSSPLTLEVPDGDGGWISKPWSIDARGVASVSFNVLATGMQTVRIRSAGRDTTLHVEPRLREQLGAFVVPYLLLAIIYEPPGKYSQAKYFTETGVSTTVSLGSSRSAGLVRSENPDWFVEVGLKAGGVLAKALGYPAVAEAAGVIQSIVPNKEIEITRESGAGEERSTGWAVTWRQEYATSLNDSTIYPGSGNAFIVLRNVLFVYAVVDGVVRLAPIGASFVTKPTAAEIHEKLPKDVADAFLALDPYRNARLMPVRRSAGKAKAAPAAAQQVVPAMAISRFDWIDKRPKQACEVTEGTVELSRSEVESTAQSSWTTETVLEKTTGLWASMTGSQDRKTSITYTSSRAESETHAQGASVLLGCDPEIDGEFLVEFYLDRLYGTFLALRGDPLTTEAAVAGYARTTVGRPAAGEIVTLSIGGETYAVRADQNGHFRFRFSSIPEGSGTLRVGSTEIPVTYRGAPIHDIELKVGEGARKRPIRVPRNRRDDPE